MAKSWTFSFGEKERMELERVMLDEDPDAALSFLKEVIYPRVRENEKGGGCYHDPSKPVDSLGRPVNKHKKLGSF